MTTRQEQTHPLYRTWMSMRSRCNNPNVACFERYGGRGITVCKRWNGARDGFANFLADMGDRPAGQQLDRIDNDGPYEPANCRWATRKEQNRNRHDSRFLEHDGRRMTLTAWSEETGIGISTIWSRLDDGWTVERALTTPVTGNI